MLPRRGAAEIDEAMTEVRIQYPPLLGRLLDNVVRRLSYEAVRALAEAPEPTVEADDAIGELMQFLQAKCRKRIDEPEFDEETCRVLRDAREGKGMARCDDLDDLLRGR
jgi:hypothetical protein